MVCLDWWVGCCCSLFGCCLWLLRCGLVVLTCCFLGLVDFILNCLTWVVGWVMWFAVCLSVFIVGGGVVGLVWVMLCLLVVLVF